MRNTTVAFQKSAKGTQALAARDPALTPKLRSLLIMVDGKRTTEELAKLAAALGDPGQLLDQLRALEFIEGTAAAPAPAPVAASGATADAGHPAVSLKEAQRFAARRLTDLLGPTGETLCLRIEAARTPAEFAQAIQRAGQVLKDFGGQQVAESFAREMEAYRPR